VIVKFGSGLLEVVKINSLAPHVQNTALPFFTATLFHSSEEIPSKHVASGFIVNHFVPNTSSPSCFTAIENNVSSGASTLISIFIGLSNFNHCHGIPNSRDHLIVLGSISGSCKAVNTSFVSHNASNVNGSHVTVLIYVHCAISARIVSSGENINDSLNLVAIGSPRSSNSALIFHSAA
jgi:hypothetical protein